MLVLTYKLNLRDHRAARMATVLGCAKGRESRRSLRALERRDRARTAHGRDRQARQSKPATDDAARLGAAEFLTRRHRRYGRCHANSPGNA